MDGAHGAVTLGDGRLVATVLPDHGCDIAQLAVLDPRIELLWQPPWGRRRPGAVFPFSPTSEDHWLRQTGGGWNLLLPNAGHDWVGDGVAWGFHGEAAMIPWTTISQCSTTATFRVALMSSPLTIERTITVERETITVLERVTNDSPDDATFAWGQHPTFTSPLIAEGVRLQVEAERVRFEGSGDIHSWPSAGGLDLSRVPARGEPRALLAYLTDLPEGCYRIINDDLDLAVEVMWPTDLWPHLWLWQELHGSPGYPWFRRTYAMAVEPHSSPHDTAPPTLHLPGGHSLTASMSLRAYSPSGVRHQV